MDRAEKTGLGVAVAGHVALFGLLSVGFLATPNPIELKPKPIEVTLADEVGLEAAAPDPSAEQPATRLAEIEGPVEPLPPPPEPTPAPPTPRPEPTPSPPRPAPKPAPRPAPQKPTPKPTPPRPAPPKPAAAKPAPQRPAAKPAPTRPNAARPTGRLSGLLDGINSRQTTSQSTRQQASQTAAQARRSIDVSIGESIRPHWRPPTGVDAERLVSVIEIRLAKDGSLAGEPRLLSQRGKTDGNAPQQKRHAEQAIKAVKLAAPFKNLPPDFYDEWKTWRFDFDSGL